MAAESEPADQLPAVLPPSASPLEVSALHATIPSLIADAGDQAVWRYVDFFAANIRNPNTRRIDARAWSTFLEGCETQGRAFGTIRPFEVRTYI